MKHFTLLSVLLAAIIIAVLAGAVLSQNKGKVEAFHQSLKFETTGDYQKAVRSLLDVYKENKNDYLINIRLGWLYYSLMNYEESNKYYTQANTIANNKSIEALLGRTLPLSALNDWENVQATYRAILKLDPMHFTANLRLGQILLNNGEYDEARRHLEKVHTGYPAEYEPNLSLGWTYYYLGDRQKARMLLTNALMLSPGDTLALQGLNLVK
ncbi:MAG: tetratricopeptide repeat protein [Bacteroidetes bacterium]|nr:tetratricopeptide repeat protein [Bacteroidota bacterium]MCW5895675.1 tetratricopeptide repeat protein [Bacteroidota bacterium]